MSDTVTYSRRGNIGVIAVDNPPVNALSQSVRGGLRDRTAEAIADPDVKAMVIICRGRTFIAGADIREFGKPPTEPRSWDVIQFIEESPKPVVAAIHGTALGGGLEVALGCHYRVAVASAKLGLPEVKLGLLPGAGGTQRLPRLAGVRVALEAITTGQPLSAKQALSAGILDAIVEDELEAAAVRFAEALVSEGRTVRRSSQLPVQGETQGIFEEYLGKAKTERRGFLAPLNCIEAVRAAVELPFVEGMKRERSLFVELSSSSQSKAQQHVFFAEREIAKIPGVAADAVAQEIRTAAVLGSGDAADAVVRCLTDVGMAVVRRAIDDADSVDADTDVVVDASGTELACKKDLFGRLDRLCHPKTILAFTAPDIDVAALAQATQRPQAVIGLNFLGAAGMPGALEIARTAQTAVPVYLAAMKLGKALGRASVLVDASHGLISTRLLSRCATEIRALLHEGASRQQVNKALYDFGFPDAVFLSERAGDDVAAAPARTLPDEQIVQRCVYSMINEGARLLDEGTSVRAVDIDMLSIRGFGFPVYRGGLMFHAGLVGVGEIHNAVLQYGKEFGPQQWSPARSLEKLAQDGKNFYGK